MRNLPIVFVLAMLLAVDRTASLAQGPEEDRAWPSAGCTILVPAGASDYATNLWPGGIVPYEFDPNVTPANQQLALTAMSKIEAVTAVDFVQRTNQPNYLYIQNSSGNSSYVGLQGGGQAVNIFNWNNQFIMVHEFMHALGLWHEQQRTDRDAYVQINYGSIQGGYGYNFDVVSSAQLFGPYDFDSVMHYAQCAFSTCCPPGSGCSACLSDPGCRTITTLAPNQSWQNLIGQLTHLSQGDIGGLRFLYCGLWAGFPGTNYSPGRGYAAAAYDTARGVTVLFGGYNNAGVPGGVLGDTWEFDGTSWNLAASSGPPARSHHAMAYDSARGVTVMFGGVTYGGVLLNDTWEWNGTTWTGRASGGPSPRQSHSMAYDGARGVVVLFGGYDTGNLGDTWEWNGTTGSWTERSTSGPLPRHGAPMAFEVANAVTVLFGGQDDSGTLLGDTWVWEGAGGTWTQVATIGPTPRWEAAMAFNSAENTAVLFGGYDGSASGLSDAWEWNGNAWTEMPLPVAGPARYTHAMAYDSLRGSMVVMGGYSGGYLGDTWEFKTGIPIILQQPLDLSIEAGQSASFTATAAGAAPLFYQWRRNGLDVVDGGSISGATTGTLTIDPVSTADAGAYDVVVSTTCGGVTTSDAAMLDVTLPCPADLDGNGSVGIGDFLLVLAQWGQCPPQCFADIDGDGAVGITDFLQVLVEWGPCP